MPIKKRPPKDNIRRVKNSGKNIRGTLVSQAGETVQRESTEERKHLLPFLRNKKYERLISQPMVIPFFDTNGDPSKYTPDLEAIPFKGPIEIHEFSLLSRSEQNRERVMGARKFCEENGYVYFIHYEDELPSDTELTDLDALIGFRAQCYRNEEVREKVHELLAKNGKVKIIELIDVLSIDLNLEEGDISNTIYHLLWHDEIKTDFEQMIILDGEPNWKVFVWLDGSLPGK